MDWKAREALAEAMILLIGKQYRENNVSLEGAPLNMVITETGAAKAATRTRQVTIRQTSRAWQSRRGMSGCPRGKRGAV